MITIHELLRDADYKAFFCSVPELPPHYYPESLPWRLIVVKKGETHFRVKRFSTYAQAFKALKKLLPQISDGTINCPALDFQPPTKVVKVKGKFHTNKRGVKQQITRIVTWTPKLPIGEYEEHNWCPYCRRPTVFSRMTRHQLLGFATLGAGIDSTLLRCKMCGASENLVNLRSPNLHQKWELNAIH